MPTANGLEASVDQKRKHSQFRSSRNLINIAQPNERMLIQIETTGLIYSRLITAKDLRS